MEYWTFPHTLVAGPLVWWEEPDTWIPAEKLVTKSSASPCTGCWLVVWWEDPDTCTPEGKLVAELQAFPYTSCQFLSFILFIDSILFPQK